MKNAIFGIFIFCLGAALYALDATTDIMIIVATALSIAFPAYLIKAIRSNDDAVTSSNTVTSCILCGAIVFYSLLIVTV